MCKYWHSWVLFQIDFNIFATFSPFRCCWNNVRQVAQWHLFYRKNLLLRQEIQFCANVSCIKRQYVFNNYLSPRLMCVHDARQQQAFEFSQFSLSKLSTEKEFSRKMILYSLAPKSSACKLQQSVSQSRWVKIIMINDDNSINAKRGFWTENFSFHGINFLCHLMLENIKFNEFVFAWLQFVRLMNSLRLSFFGKTLMKF